MALRPYPGFVGPSYTSQSKIAAFDRSVNVYAERIESGTGPAQYVLYPTPGLVVSQTVPEQPGRGGIDINGNQYFVIGTSLYQFGVATALANGLQDTTGSPVSIVTNGDAGGQLLIVTESLTYSYDLATQALTNVGTGYFIGFINGYGLRLDTTRSEVSFSALEDFTSWDPADIFQRNDAADRWVSMLIFHKEAWLYGSDTTSVYYNGDDPDTPFQPIQSVFINMGIVAPRSACVVDGSPMWIGRNQDGSGMVYKANGYTPQRVSTHAVEKAFQSYPTLASAEGSTYQIQGHVFYELTFPAESDLAGVLVPDSFQGATWVYDATEGLWHEEGGWLGLDFSRADTRGHWGSLMLSRTTGNIYTQSLDSQLDGVSIGNYLRRLRRAPHLNQAQMRTRYSHFRLLMETGLGLQSGQGVDPQVMLRWSDDGGQTFGSEYLASAGRIGAYSTLVDWWQLGQGRDRVFEVSWSEPVPFRVIDAFLDFSVGSS